MPQLVAMPAFVRPPTTLLFFFIFLLWRHLCLGPTPATDPLAMTLGTLSSSMPQLSTQSASVHALCCSPGPFLHVPQLWAEVTSVPLSPTVLTREFHSFHLESSHPAVLRVLEEQFLVLRNLHPSSLSVLCTLDSSCHPRMKLRISVLPLGPLTKSPRPPL